MDCDLTISLRRITAHVIAYRFQLESERHDQMNRMLEKLTMASEVAPRQAAKIEARADKIIARESKIEHATDLAFTPHEMLLDQAEAGLDAVEHALATMSNNPPLDDSGTSLNGGSRASIELAKSSGAGLLAQAAKDTQAHG